MLSLARVALAAFLLHSLVPALVAQTNPSAATPESAQNPEATSSPEAKQEPELTPQQAAEQFLQQFHPKTGTVQLGDLAVIKLEEGWLWLDGSDGQKLLVAFGNQMDRSVRGVALPPDFADSNIFAVYSYSDEGHVEDEEPDYDDLLQSMKADADEGSKQRKEAGLPGVKLIGWAEPPHYDKEQHKLYWAKELMFDDSDTATLNYNVRVLGRTGTLEINGVGDISQLKLVDQHCKELLRATEFAEGKRYSDFNPEYDKIAAYGIGGLIAGKLALKVGLFAKLGILLLKFLKPLLVGLAVIGGLVYKAVGGKKQAARVQRSKDAEVLPSVEE